MSQYIEKDDQIKQFFNPTSSTVIITNGGIGCDCGGNNSMPDSEEDENKKRWDWLISGWANMSFKEKMSLFMPYYHYINLRNYTKAQFDNMLNAEVLEKAYELCRNVKVIKYDPDGQGIPNIIIVFDAIDLDAIPDAAIKASIKQWGSKFGFYKNNCICNC